MAELEAIEALYYPWVEFPSVAWVKAALLYWEGILRIVPDGQIPKDPPEVAALVRAGVIQDVSPAPFRTATAETFRTRLEDLLQSRKGRPIEDEWACAAPGTERDGDERIHLTQIDGALVKWLEEKHVLSTQGEWACMSPALARLYQITIANEASRQLFAAPVTQSSGCSVASTYFAASKVASDPKAIPSNGWQWAQLYAPFPSIEAAADLSVERLIDLRATHGQLRRAYRDTIQHRIKEIATLPSPDAIRAQLEALAKEMAEELEQQREALRVAHVRNAWTLLEVGAPLSLGAGTSLVGAPTMLAAVGAFGSVGLGVADWYFERRHQEHSEGNYLLAVGKHMDRAKIASDFGDRMHRLTHGGAAQSRAGSAE
jgi:hypothetical protein